MYLISCCAEELEDSVLLSASTESHQSEPPELSSQAAMDLTAALTSTESWSDSGIPPAEPFPSSDLQSFLIESRDSQSPPSSLPVESLDPPAEPSLPAADLLCPSPVDLISSPAADESAADDSPPQAAEDAPGSEEETAEPVDAVDDAHQCGHEHGEEEPEESHFE